MLVLDLIINDAKIGQLSIFSVEWIWKNFLHDGNVKIFVGEEHCSKYCNEADTLNI